MACKIDARRAGGKDTLESPAYFLFFGPNPVFSPTGAAGLVCLTNISNNFSALANYCQLFVYT